MNPLQLDFWIWHADAIYLTIVCGTSWAVVHELSKYFVKKLLKKPYE
jgi:hypothetical protein